MSDADWRGGLKPEDVNRLTKYHDLNADVGGYIKKDRLWFFASARNFILDTLPANTFYGIEGTGTPTSAMAATWRRMPSAGGLL